jgi:predicted ATPase/class 3 adenylate cyclase/Tfp pilus assembly protein PilF
MPEWPTGTVTFLFTDIEGSTQLLQRLGAAYAAVLADHHALLRAIFARRHGHEVGTQGDAFFVVFASAHDAVEAVVEAQRALGAHPWPAGAAVRVRMGLHTGEARLESTGYVGLDVHRAARIASAGYGGQVLVSQSTYTLVQHQLGPGITLHHLGDHRLKDLQRPESIYQVVAPGLLADFGPLKTLDRHRNNLPTQPTLLLGRHREETEISAMIVRDGARLVTLTGAGGSGKTRLAIQVAAGLADHFPAGVFFIPLASIRDPGLAILTIAHTLGIRETPGLSVMDELTGALRAQQMLLLLDNFEQVTDAAPLVAELLAACSLLCVLVTSREVLRLRLEREFAVPPLARPDIKTVAGIEALRRFPAVELFCQRAVAVRPDFGLTPDNVAAVQEICARVDGLPLAIELAAARVKLLPPETIAARLKRSLSFLTGGARDQPERHQTLRNTIDWSYELLDAHERLLFDRAAVFVGGCSLGAAEAVCGVEPLTAGQVLDLLAALCDQSLLQPVETGGEPRFRMLELLREYGVERLAASESGLDVRQRHAMYFLTLAEQADRQLETRDQAHWLNQLQRDLDNLRAALDWFADTGQAEAGLRLAAALWRFWEVHGHLTEGRARLAQLLELPQSPVSDRVRTRALYVAGVLADAQCDYAAARLLFEENLRLARAAGEPRSVAAALSNLGNVLTAQGDTPAAQQSYSEALEIARALDDKIGIGWSLKNLSLVALKRGDFDEARHRSEEAQAFYEQHGVPGQVAMVLYDLANIHYAAGTLEAARQAYGRSLAVFREMGNVGAMAFNTISLGNVACRQGSFDEARQLFQEALALVRSLGDMRGTARLLESYAALALAEARPERALRLFGAAAALRTALGAPLPRPEQARVEQDLTDARRALGPVQAEAAWAAGLALTPDDAIRYAERHDG